MGESVTFILLLLLLFFSACCLTSSVVAFVLIVGWPWKSGKWKIFPSPRLEALYMSFLNFVLFLKILPYQNKGKIYLEKRRKLNLNIFIHHLTREWDWTWGVQGENCRSSNSLRASSPFSGAVRSHVRAARERKRECGERGKKGLRPSRLASLTINGVLARRLKGSRHWFSYLISFLFAFFLGITRATGKIFYFYFFFHFCVSLFLFVPFTT